MKKFIMIIALATLISASPALAVDKTNDIVIKVNGMVCDFCAQSLKKVFGKEANVNDIVVSLDDQTVTVDVKEGTELNDAKIKELIEWGGYDLIDITRVK